MQLQKCFESGRGESLMDSFGESTPLVVLCGGYHVHQW
jgi:hypothetical protein